MCKATKTVMACGHELWHYSQRCRHAGDRRCPGVEVSQTRSIDDGCADCEAGVGRHMVRAEYEHRRRQLMDEYIRARAAGDQELMAALEREMMEDVSRAREAIYRCSRGKGGVEVEWP